MNSCVVEGPLQTEKCPDGTRVLLRPLGVRVDGFLIRIEADRFFRTHFSSIPWFARWVVRWSKVDVAGVVHDWLYRTSGQGVVTYESDTEHDLRATITRRQADRFWRLLARCGSHRANALQAWACWFGLVVGGWPVWNRNHRTDRER